MMRLRRRRTPGAPIGGVRRSDGIVEESAQLPNEDASALQIQELALENAPDRRFIVDADVDS